MRKAFFVLAALAVTLAISATASGTVKALITGKDIKDGSIASRDIANGTIAARDVSPTLVNSLRGRGGAAGPAGPQGPQGATGATGPAGAAGPAGATGEKGDTGATGLQGPAGAEGASALNPVPPGKTISGAVSGDFDASVFPSDWGVGVSLPMPAKNALSDTDVTVNVAGQHQNAGQTPATSSDAGEHACTGTPEAPTAPAGVVCIYVSGADNAVNAHGVSVLFGTGASPFGFKLVWDVLHSGDTFIDGTWAYTAPAP